MSPAPVPPPRRRARRWLLAPLLLGALATASTADAATVRELPTPAGPPVGITAGPDGALWFTEQDAGRIGRIATDGRVTDFSAEASAAAARATTRPPGTTTVVPPTTTTMTTTTATTTVQAPPPVVRPAPRPRRIAADGHGRLWFTDAVAGISTITVDGGVTRYAPPYALPTEGITRGPDGAIWFTVPAANRILRVEETPDGPAYRDYPLDGDRRPTQIVAGPDGALWFLEPASNSIGRLTPAGVLSHHPIPTAGAAPEGLTVGPDGALWFTEPGTHRIGRITTGGQISELVLPGTDTRPGAIASGPDGALWFTELAPGRNSIGRITVQGAASRYPLPGSGASAGLVLHDDALWYTRGADRVGSVTPLRRPVAGKTAIVEPMDGRVRVRPPGAPLFRDLPAEGALLPTGTQIDTREGHVRVTHEIGTGAGLTKTADFRDGRFEMTQPATKDGMVTMRLIGKLLNCPAPRRRAAGRTAPATTHAAAKKAKKPKAKKKPRGRRLWGNGKGKYRIRGTRAVATVRGTNWGVEDTCNRSTIVRVREGTVTVRDLLTGRDRVVRKGGRYVARR